ncbi:hypothetical protein OAU96_02420 [Planctomycetota bacterium]|nr:hypothetical protein [Planctomycetota bacterium]
MVWTKAGSTTLGSAGDIMTITGMTASKFNVLLFHEIADGTLDNQALTYNGNTNAVYARRTSTDGGGDATAVSASNDFLGTGNIAHDHFRVQYMCSIDGEEKLIMHWEIRQGTAGSGGTPSRHEHVGKFVPSPDVGITSITDTNNGTGDFGISSNLSALGSDLTPSAGIQNAQTNSIFIDPSTAKRYWFNGTTWVLET